MGWKEVFSEITDELPWKIDKQIMKVITAIFKMLADHFVPDKKFTSKITAVRKRIIDIIRNSLLMNLKFMGSIYALL